MYKYFLAGPEYLQDICCIEEACFNNPWSRKSIEEMLTEASSVAVIAVNDNEAIGYASAYIGGDMLYINNVAVLSEFRRRGVAKNLLHNLLRYAARNGASEATLEVRTSNTAAKYLYEGCGFTEVGIRKRYYSCPEEDAIIMNLTGVGIYAD